MQDPKFQTLPWLAQHRHDPTKFWLANPHEKGDQNWFDAFQIFREPPELEDWRTRALQAEKALKMLEDKGLLQSLLDMDTRREEGEDDISGASVRFAREVILTNAAIAAQSKQDHQR